MSSFGADDQHSLVRSGLTADMECVEIGTVETPYGTTAEIPRQGFQENAPGVVVLDEAYAPGLVGFDPDDHVVVVWAAHEADRSVIEFPERDGGRGVFTTRSPARPNPIGLSHCVVTGVGGPRLRVRGVDMLSGSPVLDLKPPLGGREDWDPPA